MIVLFLGWFGVACAQKTTTLKTTTFDPTESTSVGTTADFTTLNATTVVTSVGTSTCLESLSIHMKRLTYKLGFKVQEHIRL